MEKEGFIRVLRRIQSNSVKVDIVATDRHVQIRKLLRVDPEFNHIKHEFDPWHISKSLVKKLNKGGKEKRMRRSSTLDSICDKSFLVEP